jgi:hypothetical protein
MDQIEQESEEVQEQADPEIIEIISWKIPEYEKHERSKLWYILFGLIGLAMLIYAIVTANFLFAVIIVIGGFILILNDARNPRIVGITISSEGVFVGRKFYDYDEIKDFSIIYKPTNNIKQLYFEFKSRTKQRLSLPLTDVNPLFLRENLLQYLTEDLERTDQSTSEILAKILKI